MASRFAAERGWHVPCAAARATVRARAERMAREPSRYFGHHRERKYQRRTLPGRGLGR
jgi:hypothetical protein